MNSHRRSCTSIPPSSNGVSAFALPSTLFLITILTLLASSVIAIIGFYHRQVLKDIGETRALWAAESAIAITIERIASEDDLTTLLDKDQVLHFSDEGMATVELLAWGAYLAIKAEGVSGQSRKTEVALVGDQPGELFQHALVFANSSHQLVFSGDSRILGDVRTGPRGAATGSLRGRPKPPVLPIVGELDRDKGIALRELSLRTVERMFNDVRQARFFPEVSELSAFSDTTTGSLRVDLSSPQIVTQVISRTLDPLYIHVAGSVTIESEAILTGLVCLVAEGGVTVKKGAVVDHAVVCSNQSITVEKEAVLRGQLIAPKVVLGKDAFLQYPSLIVLSPEPEGLVMEGGSSLEGTLLIGEERDKEERVYAINSGARVTGAVYSLSKITLDGEVTGSVATQDFFFYEAPTRYLGWLRSGKIDRTSLPGGFLLPPGVNRDYRLSVLDWL